MKIIGTENIKLVNKKKLSISNRFSKLVKNLNIKYVSINVLKKRLSELKFNNNKASNNNITISKDTNNVMDKSVSSHKLDKNKTNVTITKNEIDKEISDSISSNNKKNRKEVSKSILVKKETEIKPFQMDYIDKDKQKSKQIE